jgi:hypothetical protein
MVEESVDMPYLHPRRRWRSALASAAAVTMLAVVAGCGVAAINKVDLLTRYMNDYRFFLQKNADFLVADVSDRDAGWYAQPANGGRDTFWTDRQTSVETDGGNLISKTIAYHNSSGAALK